MIQDVEYNGIRGSAMRIFARERPPIPAARLRMDEITIPGRDGVLYQSDGGYEPTEIPVTFNYIGRESQWGERWRMAQKWLSARNSILRFSDDDGFFFRVSKVELDENDHSSARVGVFAAKFITRDGLYYLNSGLRECAADEVTWNSGETAHPVYKITGEGSCTLTVNGKKMTANVGQNLTIDTERMIAYRKDGTLQNTAVTGKYEELYLVEGANEVSISNGFELRIIPNWRCK